MKILNQLVLLPCLAPLPLHREHAEDSPFEPQEPRYELQLSLPELSFLQSTAVQGVVNYGGEARYDVHFYQYQETVYAQVTFETEPVIDGMFYLVNEHLAETLAAVDFDAIDPIQRFALETGRTVRSKLDAAKETPQYDLRPMQGTLAVEEGSAFLVTNDTRLRIAGEAADHAELFRDRPVLIEGSIRKPGVLTAETVRVVERNTLDLFIMSLCPFGQRATRLVADGLARITDGGAPEIRVHYIFYEGGDEEGEAELATLHGEPEIVENLVQMVIQEQYGTELFFRYLTERAASDEGWPELAQRIGLVPEDVDVIRFRIEAERDELIRREYELVTGNFGVFDGSPFYLWEGQKARPEDIPFLRGLDMGAGEDESCSADALM